MKKLPAFLNNPTKLVITVGLCILLGEFLIILLFEGLRATALNQVGMRRILFEFIDPIVLSVIIAPVLYFLVCKPMREQQSELERQLDELRNFQKLSIGRELRMKELTEEVAALRKSSSVEPVAGTSATSYSVEASHHAAERHVATPPTEQNHLNALLFMLEDLEATRKQVEQAHQEWIAALDVVGDPIFLHDKEFRILRCNRAYQQCAGIPFHEIIGRLYYEVFPKNHAPMPCCLRAMEKEEEEEEEVVAGNASYRSRSFSVHDEQGAHLYSVHILEDITERKRAEQEQQWNAAVNAALAGLSQYFLSVPQLVIEDVSARVLDAARELTGSEFGYVGYIDADTGFLVSPTLTRDIWDQCQVAGKSIAFEKWGGLWGWVLTNKKSLLTNAPSADPRSGGIPQGHVPIKRFLSAPALAGEELMGQISLANADHDYTGRDMAVVERLASFYTIIVQRMSSEKALRDSEAFIKSVLDNLPVGIAVNSVEPSVTFSYMNDNFPRFYKTTRDKLAAPDAFWNAVYEEPEFREKISKQVLEDCASGNVERMHWDDVPITRKGEKTVFVMARNIPVPDKRLMISMVWDVTERKRAEQEIKSISDRLQHILASTPAVHYACRIDSERFVPTFASPNLQAIWGYAPTDYLDNAEWWWSAIHPEDRDKVVSALGAAVMATDRYHYAHEYRFRRKDGTYRWIHDELQILRGQDGQPVEIVGSWLDITERKQAEVAVHHANRALATLSAVNRSLVHASDENKLLQVVCDAIVKQRGYRMAWVGYKQHDERKSIKVMARAGHDEGYLDDARLTWAESEYGMRPCGRTIRSGATQLCQDIAHDPHYSSWCDEARQRGYAASIALPLLNTDNTVFGTLAVYSNEAHAFIPAEIDLLEEMAGDLAFGVQTLHVRRERDLGQERIEQQFAQLQDSLEDTMRAIAGIVEMRDPYTAGHQQRVAQLAATIAVEMGLPEEQVHGIHLAGTVHDLGKINVPAEILSKPGHLSEIEYSLIKVHPQAGYDILKGIDFPWPIAQTVLQHHERIDGSGYPQGLKGEAILLEARILAVADVVEAISAHRPYRPGLGIEMALEEITKQRGIYFDPQVVDACLVLFHERGYQLSS